MTIIEQSLIPKSPTKRSEDAIVVTPDFIAVIDGSTSKSQRRCHRELSLRRHSNGELAMLSIAAVIRKMKKGCSCHQFCLEATASVRSRYKKDLLPHLAIHPEDRLTASCIVFSRLRREIWMIGDCQALITSKGPAVQDSEPLFLDNPKPSEQMLAEQRAAIIKASPKPWDHFLTADTARDAIIPSMLEAMKQQNNGYSVIDGFPVDMSHVRIVTLDLKPWEIVLASDGYPFLCPTLEESEERLAWQRANDPLNIGDFKATKAFAEGNNSFDDRAYIRFTA
jgi:glycerophosphoryl diester phosphodiesterase